MVGGEGSLTDVTHSGAVGWLMDIAGGHGRPVGAAPNDGSLLSGVGVGGGGRVVFRYLGGTYQF